MSLYSQPYFLLLAAGMVDESLKWTIIGAIGSWAGSVFGAIALVISILAFRQPLKTKIKVEVKTGFMLSQIPGVKDIEAYVITVKNIGVKPITINNVYLNFGGKKKGNIFVGMLNKESLLQYYDPQFPKRLDQGESFNYYLLRDRLKGQLGRKYKNNKKSMPFNVCVDEVTTGQTYYRTKWTLGTFVGNG